jgi:hypothetical protein
MAHTAPITNLANLRIFVELEEVADIYHITVKTLRRKCSEGTFSPAPARKYPYLWRRDDILRDINGPSKRLPKRAHGFAATKARRLRADHDADAGSGARAENYDE